MVNGPTSDSSGTITAPGALPAKDETRKAGSPHAGVLMSGVDGNDGPKAFYIHIEALPGKEDEVLQMLHDILACVEEEPATGPWYGVRYSMSVFAIFEAFPNLAGRQAHINGGGGAIFRDVERMNSLLVRPAHVAKVDVLLSKEVFSTSTEVPG